MEIRKFGPVRTLGYSMICDNNIEAIPEFWMCVGPKLYSMPHIGNTASFGICRCTENPKPGKFEYIVAVEYPFDDLPREGMVKVLIPEREYLAIPVESLDKIAQAFANIGKCLEQFPDYQSLCGPKGCRCHEAVMFEYYPPDFPHDSTITVFVPVEKKE